VRFTSSNPGANCGGAGWVCGSSIASWSETSIEVTVPNDAADGVIEVITNGQPSNSKSFALGQVPHISSVSPNWGEPEMTQVTITGTHFGTSGTLKLNDQPVTVLPGNWNNTSITLTIPQGATTGNFVVETIAQSNGVPFAVGELAEYYVTDAIGSVRMVTGHNGYVFARHDYFPFGGEPSPTSGLARDGFAGTQRGAETGGSTWDALSYLGARRLHEASRRFASVDPGHVGARMGDPQTWSGYAYVNNNPLRFVDPDGRQSCAAACFQNSRTAESEARD
jgi:RHS repeat-associated protein